MNYQKLILKELKNIREENKLTYLQGALWGFELATKIAKEEIKKAGEQTLDNI